MNVKDLKPGSYAVLSSVNQPDQQVPDNRDLLQKAGDFAQNLPGGQIGAAVGNALVTGKEYLTGHPDIARNISATAPTAGQVAGSGANAALLFAGGGFGAAEKGASLGAKALNLGKNVGIGAGIGYGTDVASKLESGRTDSGVLAPGAGTAIGAAIPGAGAIASFPKAVISRLVKGLGSGLSGVSADTIEKIVSNPEFAQQATEKMAQSGSARVLEDNAKTIVNGVSKIRNEARNAYGQGVQALKTTDINPKTFRDSIQPVLDSFGAVKTNGVRSLENVEFTDPKNVARASGLIDRLSNTKLDGASLRKLADDIENSKYKVATSDERLSFNAFINDLSSSVKNAINSSTDKLSEINSKFSNDMQLTEAVQNIFGKVNFRNLPEVVKASQKLDGLFKQKGLAPEVTDSFLKRIGINPNQFKTSEAVRQIDNVTPQANSQGLSFGEVLRSTTSAVVTPDMVKQLSIFTGLAKEKLTPFLDALKPAARNILIQAAAQAGQEPQMPSQPQGGTEGLPQ